MCFYEIVDTRTSSLSYIKLKRLNNDIKTKSISKTCTIYETKIPPPPQKKKKKKKKKTNNNNNKKQKKQNKTKQNKTNKKKKKNKQTKQNKTNAPSRYRTRITKSYCARSGKVQRRTHSATELSISGVL